MRSGMRLAAVLFLVCGVAHGATFTVTNGTDVGYYGTLQEAIDLANATPGKDTIDFQVPPVGTPISIQPTNPLPTITDPVLIDGWTQIGGAACQAGVEIDGSALVAGQGLWVATTNCVLRGLCINRMPWNGILLRTGGNHQIYGCFLGTDITGATDLGNGNNGIAIVSSVNNAIGLLPTYSCTNRNIISGNGQHGVELRDSAGTPCSGNILQNNHIGVDFNGNVPLANDGDGVALNGSLVTGNDIGSTAAPKPVNVISGNRTNGVYIYQASLNNVRGNHIGVVRRGDAGMGNGLNGVWITNATGNSVGDNSGEARNVISGNGEDGVEVGGLGTSGNFVYGNYIGLASNGFGAIPNGGHGVLLTSECTQNRVGDETTPNGRNVISGNDECGVKMGERVFGNWVHRNYIGLSANGMLPVTNRHHGVLVESDARGNFVGSGGYLNSGNVIAGNGHTNTYHGVCIQGGAWGIEVDRNVIGLNAFNFPVPNAGDGVHVEGAHTNMIGTLTAGAGNVISGNGLDGVRIGPNATGNFVFQNIIGLDTNGAVALANGGEGVHLYRAAWNFIGTNAGPRNVISGNAGSGVLIEDNALAHDNLVLNNYIGTDVTGGNRVGNSDHGVYILGGVSNWVGGEMGGGNVIAGNDLDGVRIQDSAAAHNKVYRNLVGVDASGMVPLGNGQYGVSVFSASRTAIGESGGRGNVIGGNADDGVHISGSAAAGNTLHANNIGTDATWTYVLSNRLNGVWIGVNASGNSVGGDSVAYINHIWYNGGSGVRVVSGTNNAILGNTFCSNALLGIDIGPLGVTANDVQDPDTGANFLQNYPVLYEATTGSVRIAGCLNAMPLTEYWLEFYRVAPYDAGSSTHGEGYNPMYATNLTTDASGNVAFEVVSPVVYPAGDRITATATDPFGNTSEFAANVEIVPTNLYGDADGDGMPTRWEGPNHLDPYDPTGTNGAAGDPDGDDIPNLDEYVADTDPSDPTNYFHFTAIVRTNSTIVTYTSTNTRYYVVGCTTDLLDGASWSDVHPLPVAGSNGVTSASDAGGSTVRVYRAQVRLTP